MGKNNNKDIESVEKLWGKSPGKNYDDIELEEDPKSIQFKDDTLSVEIEQPKDGFWNSVKVIAKIPLPPKKVFDVLTDPSNRSIFRSIKRVNYRKVIKDDGRGRKTVEVEHVGQWKFGWFKGQFTVRLLVKQDRNRGKIRFALQPIKNNFMKNFSGEWTIEPYDQDSLDEMVRYPGKRWGMWHQVTKAVHRFEERFSSQPTDSLVQLKQSVAPAMLPPPPLDRVLKSITLAQVKAIMEDLMGETKRINERESLEMKKPEHDIFSFCRSLFDSNKDD